MSLDGFDRCQRGGLILRWTPGGDLDKFVVMRTGTTPMVREVTGVVTNEPAVFIGQVHEDGSMAVDGGDTVLTKELVEQEEAFGYTYIFTTGETFALPEWMP